MDVALAFASAFPLKAIGEELLPVVLKLAGDRSWRVRFLVAASFNGLAEKIFIPCASSVIEPVGLFTALLTDAEAEVRTAAARQLAETCAHFNQADFESKILPVLRQLASDPSVSVRAALATQLNPLSAIAGAEMAAVCLFPLYTHFFADENSQVRLNAVSKMDVVCQVLGIEKLSQSILPAIVHLAEDKQWRVREAVIEHLPTLTSHLVSGLERVVCGSWLTNANFLRLCVIFLSSLLDFSRALSASRTLPLLF